MTSQVLDLDGPRAREGDHDQGPGGPPRVHRPRRPDSTASTSSTRPATSTSAYEVSRSPPGLRGRDPGGRRDAGDRGPDAGQRPPRARARTSTIIPVLNKIDLPSAQTRRGHRGAGERPGDPARGGPASPRPRTGPASPRSSRPSWRGFRRPKGDPDAPASGPDLRHPLRRLQGRRDPCPAGPGHAPRARPHPADGLGRRGGARSSSGFFRPQLVPVTRAACRRRRLRGDRPQERPRRPGRRHGHDRRPRRPTEPLPGYQPAKSLVFAGIYPISGADYPLLRDALEKLHLNDASFSFEPESLGRPRLRLPLRLPGPAPHGDRPGAARARVRPRPDRARRRRSSTRSS